MEPRQECVNRIDWYDYHMLQACLAATRSPDPNTQVGAVIVDQKNRMISTGYNGLPRGIRNRDVPWERSHEDPLQTKYPWVMHAERNAILNAKCDLEGALLYVTMYPCNECAKEIISAGIRDICYLTNPYPEAWQTKAAREMFDLLRIRPVIHQWHSEPQKLLSQLATVGGFSAPGS